MLTLMWVLMQSSIKYQVSISEWAERGDFREMRKDDGREGERGRKEKEDDGSARVE